MRRLIREVFSETFRLYLQDPTPERLELVAQLIETMPFTEEWIGREKIKEKIQRLQSGNKEEWAGLLYSVMRLSGGIFKELKALSPFANQTLLFIKYGDELFSIYIEGNNEWLRTMAGEIIEQKGKETSCAIHLISLPKEFTALLERAETVARESAEVISIPENK